MKYSLHIGINHYPKLDSDLDGCVNDALDWANALKKRGFNTKLLIEEDATKEAIIQEIINLIQKTKKGDIALITFSGHGTWRVDRNNDEIDRQDEALCPVDVSEGNIILDDELYQIFANRKWGAKVVFISDCCYSGTLNMALKKRAKIRFLPPYIYLQKNVKSLKIVKKPQKIKKSSALLLSACRDFEYSYDAFFNKRANGVFTYYALKALEEMKKDASFNKWYRSIRKYLPNQIYPQTPQIVGTAYQKYRWKLT